MARLQSEDMLDDDVVCCLLGSLQLDAFKQAEAGSEQRWLFLDSFFMEHLFP